MTLLMYDTKLMEKGRAMEKEIIRNYDQSGMGIPVSFYGNKCLFSQQ